MEHHQIHWSGSATTAGQDPLPNGPWGGHHFEECTFEGLDLSGRDWRQARFQRCTFLHCKLDEIRLTDTGWQEVEFRSCSMVKLRWSSLRSFLLEFKLIECQATLGDWEGLDMQGIALEDCDLSGSNFSGADCRKTTWSGCRMRDVVFHRTDLREADFRGAKDWYVDPAQNRVKGARFDPTDLSGLVKALGIRLD